VQELARIFAAAGCRGHVAAYEVDGTRAVELGADEVVPAASVFKVAVALAVFCLAEADGLDLQSRRRLCPPDVTPGPTGFSTFADPVDVSVRDLAAMMLMVSDNAATDVLIELVGIDEIKALLRRLELTRTAIPTTIAEMLKRSVALDAAHGITTTARDMARLLRLIWRDEAGPRRACAQVRQLMSRQPSRRLANGFDAGTRIVAKSGSLFGVVRHEIGVIETPDGGRYAVGVLTRADQPGVNGPAIERAIGLAAARAVAVLAAAGARPGGTQLTGWTGRPPAARPARGPD
jgi:beta-lactamase class A